MNRINLLKCARMRIAEITISAKDKVDIMEHLLAQNGETLQQISNDGDVGIFYHNCIKMLLNGDLVDYFQLLKMCKEMAEHEKEQRKDVDFL